MTAPHDPEGPVPEATPLEELASALLDGEAGADEAARAADPEVVALQARFTRVADALAAVPAELDDADDRRESAIAAALGEWGTAPTAAGDELAARRAARARIKVLGIAAAVVAAVALGGAVVRSTGGSDDADLASSAPAADAGAGRETTAAADAGGGAATGAGGSAGSDAATTSAFAVADDLGVVADLDDLLARVSVATDGSALDSSNDAGGPTEQGATTSGLGDATAESEAAVPTAGFACAPEEPLPDATYTAVLDGRPVLVEVRDGGAAVLVRDLGDCRVVYDGPG